jgi:hypothetical protein
MFSKIVDRLLCLLGGHAWYYTCTNDHPWARICMLCARGEVRSWQTKEIWRKVKRNG